MSTQSKTPDKKAPLNDDEVLVLVEKQVNQGVGFVDSKLAKEREKVLKYYNSTLPARQSPGRSSYVSTDVYDSVEAMKAQLLETFAGNPDNLVSFPPLKPQDIDAARIATEYCSHQIFSLNDGYEVMNHAIHDGLVARVGITKVHWLEEYDDIEEQFDGLAEPDVHALAASEEVVSLDADEVAPGSGMFCGKLVRRNDTSHVDLTPVPPEEFVITRSAPTIKRARMVCHRTLKGKDELIREGFPQDKVLSINWSDARSLDLTGEKLEREEAVTDLSWEEDTIQPETQRVMLYETYMRMDMYDGRGVKLWKICHAGRVLLTKEEIDRAPFMTFIPLPIPHIFHGNAMGWRVIPTQNARTVLTRAILDHASITTNTRYTVVKGGLLNAKEMLDNRLGGIVNVTRPDAIAPLEQANLNPFVFQTLEMLKQNKEESTGISALSQGLNKDAISTQNSAALVDNLVTLSQQRQKIIARNFAYGYLIPLYLEVYRLVLENQKKDDIIEVAGNFVPIKVSDWVERKVVKVALHLGYGERDRQTKKLADAHGLMISDPGTAPMYGPQQRYALLQDLFRSAALENRVNYIMRPEQIAAPQPDPLKVQEVQAKSTQAQAALTTAQANAQVDSAKAQMEAMRVQIDQMQAQLKAMMEMRDAARKDADVANRIDVAQRETKLLEEAPKVNAIAAPR